MRNERLYWITHGRVLAKHYTKFPGKPWLKWDHGHAVTIIVVGDWSWYDANRLRHLT